MTNEDIFRIALLQSSYDCNCNPEDFLSNEKKAGQGAVLLCRMVKDKVCQERSQKRVPACLGRAYGKGQRVCGWDEQVMQKAVCVHI